MPISKGRDAVILVATTSPGATAVGKHMDASLDQTLEDADSTTNDSAGSREHVVTFDSGQLTFKVLADEADGGQSILRAAYAGKTQIYCRYRPLGTGAGRPQHDFLCSVTLKPSTPMSGLRTIDVTLKRSGPETIANQ